MSYLLSPPNYFQLLRPSFDDNDERVSALISTANTWDPANLLILISYRVTRVCLSCSTLAPLARLLWNSLWVWPGEPPKIQNTSADQTTNGSIEDPR